MIVPINQPLQSLNCFVDSFQHPHLSMEVTIPKALDLLLEILLCFSATSYCPTYDDRKIKHGEQHRECQI